MEQKSFIHRGELVQAYQLGELLKDYTVGFGRLMALICVAVLLSSIVFFTLLLLVSTNTALALPSALVYALVLGTASGGVLYYFYRRFHVYL